MESSSRSSSLRICVAYGSRRAASGLHSVISSSVDANAPGVYSSPEDAPHAPSASADSTMATIARSSSGVAGRSLAPITRLRTVPSPIIDITLTAGRSASIEANNSVNADGPPPSGLWPPASGLPVALELPSCPTTMVVMPCLTSDSMRGSSRMPPSPWECRSTNPGATTMPRASISSLPRPVIRASMAEIFPAAMAMSASRPGSPEPSSSVPPRMTRSCAPWRVTMAGARPVRSATSDAALVMTKVRRSVVISRVLWQAVP